MFARNFYLIGGVLAALFLFGVFTYTAGKNGCEVRELKQDVKQIEIKREIKNEIATLPDDDLDERLDKWMRD